MSRRLVALLTLAASLGALAAGQLDGLVSTIDTLVLYLKQGNEYQHVLALDDSAGGDGLVANYTFADNQKFFGTPASPGGILTTARNSVDIWGELGKLQGKIDPKATLNWTAVGR